MHCFAHPCEGTVAETWMDLREQEYWYQATFRHTSATISSDGRAPIGKEGRQCPYMLAVGYEDENFYPTLRDAEGVLRFFDRRTIEWWRHFVSLPRCRPTSSRKHTASPRN